MWLGNGVFFSERLQQSLSGDKGVFTGGHSFGLTDSSLGYGNYTEIKIKLIMKLFLENYYYL